MPKLARIAIHPVKSFDPLVVEEAVLLAGGGLQHDRRFALRDRRGEFINGKRTAAVHMLRTELNVPSNRLTVRIEGSSESRAFDVRAERRELESWLSDYFAEPVEWVEDAIRGFPDDTDSPGPTVISTATLAEVAGWFPGMTVEEARGRFRANLEIDGVEAFWEDRLVARGGRAVRFRIGEAELLGTNACARCVVPSRDPHSGESTREFSRLFASRRQATLPAWAPREPFDHFYRLAVNTRPAGARECVLRRGDEVRVVDVAGGSNS